MDDTKPILRVRPGNTRDTYRITARSIIGSVETDGLKISILPKCGLTNLRMLLTHSPSALVQSQGVASVDSGDLVSALADHFLDELSAVVELGLQEGYGARSEIGSRPLGSIDFGWFGSGLGTPLRFTYQRYSADIPENRLLRHTLEFLVGHFGTDRKSVV